MDPTRDELAAAIGPTTRVPDLMERFDLSDHRVRRLMADYGIPSFRAGNPSKPSTTEDAPDEPELMRPVKPRPRTPVDDLCDRLAANYQRRAKYRLQVVLRRAEDPAPDPIGATLGDKWRDRALCRGLDPDLFMPKPRKKGANHRETINDGHSKRICAVCPVRDVCPFSEATRTTKERAQAAKVAA